MEKDYVGFKESKPWIQLKPGFMAGISHSRFKMESSYVLHRAYIEAFSGYVTPLGGLTIKVNSPRISERIAIQLDVLYQDLKFSRINTKRLITNTRTSNIDLGAKTIAFPFSLSYTVNRSNYSPFIKFGASHILNFGTYSTHSVILETSLGENRFNAHALEMSKNQWGIWAGLGVEKAIKTSYTGFIEIRGGVTDGFYGSYFIPDYAKTNIYSLQLFCGLRL